MTSAPLLLIEEVHAKQVRGTPTTSQKNEYNVLFPRKEEGKVDVGSGVYETSNQTKRANFTYEQEVRFIFGVAKV